LVGGSNPPSATRSFLPAYALLSADEIGAKLHISGRCVLNWLYDDTIPAAVRQGTTP
jgi:hypothetical protein